MLVRLEMGGLLQTVDNDVYGSQISRLSMDHLAESRLLRHHRWWRLV